MTKKLMLIGMFTVITSVFSLNQPAYAHFPVEDKGTGVKAIFHVTPNHEPIAGKASVISYDFTKTGYEGKDYYFSLTVKPTKGEVVNVPIDGSSNVVLATYTFPAQGFYDIRLTATRKDNGTVSKLQYGQRVASGVIAEETQSFGFLKLSVVIGVVLVAVGAVIYSLISDNNKRKAKKK